MVNAAPDRYQWMFSNDLNGYFFDTKTIKYDYNSYTQKVDKNTIDVWIKTVFTEAGVQDIIKQREKYRLPVQGFENTGFSLEHFLFSRDNKICDIEFIYYSKSGDIIENYTFPTRKWISIVPGTIAEEWHNEVWMYSSDKANSILMEFEAQRGK